MCRFLLGVGLMLFIALPSAWATDYENVKVVRYNKTQSTITIEVDSAQRRIKVADACTFMDEQGKKVAHNNGLGLLSLAKRATIKTMANPADPETELAEHVHINPSKTNTKPSETTKTSRSGSKKGGIDASTRTVEKLDLHPDANFNGKLADVAVPARLLRWFPSAKVGDFVEQSTGTNGWARNEVVAFEGNAVILATMVQIETTKSEVRVRMKLAPDQKKLAGNTASVPSGKASGTEIITVGDRKLKCTVFKDGRLTNWYCPEVPLDGIVKQETANGHQLLLDFGKGK